MRFTSTSTFAAMALAIALAPARAEFVTITQAFDTATIFPSSQVVGVYRAYAQFSSPEDRLVAVNCAIANADFDFYQHPFGTWTEPSAILLPLFPDLAYDTFLTIGLTATQPGQPGTVLDPASTFGADRFEAGWSTSVDGPHTHGPSVLLAQLTIPFPLSIPGCGCAQVKFVLDWIDAAGQSRQSCMSRNLDWDATIPCIWPHRADFNHDCTVNGIDLAMLLAHWGHHDCPGLQWDCPFDLTCDPDVAANDLMKLLNEWGPITDCALGR